MRTLFNDFTVNESILTGESLAGEKFVNEDNKIYSGTLVTSGMAIARVTKVGNATELGRIGKLLKEIEEEQTPLQLQIRNFVKKMAIIGRIIFVIVWAFNFFQSRSLVNSLLKALTLVVAGGGFGCFATFQQICFSKLDPQSIFLFNSSLKK